MNGDPGAAGGCWLQVQGAGSEPLLALYFRFAACSVAAPPCRERLLRPCLSHPALPLTLCPSPRCPVGKKGGGAKQQCVFLPYIDALSVVVAGREAQRPHLRQAQRAAEAVEAGALGAPEGEQLSFLPPSMPCFSATDLAFVVKFASVGGGGVAKGEEGGWV